MRTVTYPLRASVLPPPIEHSAAARNHAELLRHAATQALFADITRTFGVSFVPDLFVGMRDRPAYLEAAWELFKEDFRLDSLDFRTKRIMALAITTNEDETYYIASYPHAFRLNALDHAICDKLLCTIRFVNAFDPHLSGVNPEHLPKATRVVCDCLREEYLNSGATSPSLGSSCRADTVPVASWIGGIVTISFLLLLIAAGAYLVSP
ncbi:MAG: hypothetical protein Q8L77_11110 [Nitrospirota bacterium]|nr:hypothetical protein [Nitrospirota bacterium]